MGITYSNSSLVDYVCISPNKFTTRKSDTYNPTGAITVFTPHHMAGNASIETLGALFANPAREASANYGIGSDGRLALYVDEKHTPWTSNSFYNDFRAVTVEVANDGGPESNWHVSDKAFEKLVALGVDVCKRNGITHVTYTGDTSGNLTRHNMFIATVCPGGYLESRFPELADKINAQLAGPTPGPTPTPTPTPTTEFHVDDLVKVSPDATIYGTTEKFADFVYTTDMYVTYVPDVGDRIVFSTSKGGPATGATAAKYLTKVGEPQPQPTPTPTPTPTPSTGFKVGDVVRVQQGAPVYGTTTQFSSFVYTSDMYVREVPDIGDRIVISTVKVGPVTGAVAAKYLTKVGGSTTTAAPTQSKPAALKVGDAVRMKQGAPIYGTNTRFDSFVYNTKLYLRELDGSRAVVSTLKRGAVTGAVDVKYLTKA